MPALTWDREDLEYIIWAYKQGVLLEDMEEILGRDRYAISNCAGRLGLTDQSNVQRVRYEKGIAKITPEVLSIIEELIADWGYSCRKTQNILNIEYGIKVSKTALLYAINNRISAKAKNLYKRKWSKYNKYKPFSQKKWDKKGPEYIKQALEKQYV